jgi:GNAT superfamily N-acetyltransferase
MKIDKGKVVLRKVINQDIDTIIDHRIIFLREVQGAPAPELESRLRQSLKKYLTVSLETDKFVSWIADYKNRPVGFGGMVIREQPGNFELPNGRTGYILNMYTVKKFRRNGIGTLLFQKLIDEARSRNLDRIELHATKNGEPIYRQFGFTDPHDKVLEMIIK